MQTVARDDLTAAQVTALIEAENLEVTAGLELYDADETFIEDISDDLVGGTVDRGNYRTIHGTCRLLISRELQWGSQRVKPYLILTASEQIDDTWNSGTWNDGNWNGGTQLRARFDLGVFLLSTPERRAGETPATFDVDGYDKLEILAHPHGTSYEAAEGDAYLTLVEDLITGAGESKILLDQTAAATTLPTTRVWPLLDRSSEGQGQEGGGSPTTLNIVNDLLAAVGYRALWVDQDGYYRSEPYQAPADRGAEWTYSADSDTTTVAEDRMAGADYFATPNRWVFVNDDPAATTFPTEGDGIYTTLNQSDGPTSIDERGRTITRVVPLAAASQTDLVTQGDAIVATDKRLDQRLTLSVSPNPLHLHFDVVAVTDAQLGLTAKKYLVTDWSLPLDGGDQSLEMKAV